MEKRRTEGRVIKCQCGKESFDKMSFCSRCGKNLTINFNNIREIIEDVDEMKKDDKDFPRCGLVGHITAMAMGGEKYCGLCGKDLAKDIEKQLKKP